MYVRMFDLRSKSFKNAASVEPMEKFIMLSALWTVKLWLLFQLRYSRKN